MDAFFNNIETQIKNELSSASKQIIIAVAWFTNDNLFEIIISKLKENVSISLVVIYDEINCGILGVDFQRFISSGGKLYFSNKKNIMHNKFCIIDNKTLINGSYNWTYYAEYRNKENVMLIKDEEMIQKFMTEFSNITSKLNLTSSFNRKDKNSLISDAKKLDASTKNEIISDLFSFAFSEFEKKNYEKSLSLLNDIISIDSTYTNAIFLKSINYLKLDKYDTFIIEVNNVINYDATFDFISNIDDSENNKIIEFFNKNYNLHDIKKSCLYANYIIKYIQPIENKLLYDIGYCYFYNSLHSKSIEIANKYIQLEPQKTSGYHLLGRIHHEKSELTSSEKNYSKSIEVDSEQYSDYWNRHLVYNKLSNINKGFEVALIHLKEKIGYNITLIDEYINYINIFFEEKKCIDEYIHAWKSILDLLYVIKNCNNKITIQSDERPMYSYYVAKGHSLYELGFKKEASNYHLKAQELIDNLSSEDKTYYENKQGLKIDQNIIIKK